jgi:hypothetical protein
MTDYKALCAELYGIFEKYDDESNLAGIYWDMETDGNDVLDRARDALGQSETEGPTDEEIMELMPQEMHADLAAAARAMTEQAGTDSTRVKGLHRIILNRHAVDLARAVLARWGNL